MNWLPVRCYLICLLLSCASQFCVAAEADTKGLQALVTTVDDQQVSGPIVAVADGRLQLATEPPRTIPLEDVLRIEFGKSTAAAVASDLKWIGQDNQDLVQVGGASGGNGIQDLHLRATNLKPLAIKQIIVACRFPKRVRVWRLDTSMSPHWRLAIARTDLATEADLYLEPDAIDSFDQKYEVTYTYSDDSTTKASVTASTHTSDQLKVDKGQQPGQAPVAAAPSGPSKAEIYLADSGRMYGEVRQLTPESLTLATAWQADAQVPLVRVRGLWFGQAGPTGARADFDKQLVAPASEDVVFLVAPDKSAATVQGSVRGLSDGRLTVHFEGADRNVKQERLLGIIFAAQAKTQPVAGAYQVFRLLSGDVLAGHWRGLTDGQLEIETLWQTSVKVPAAQLSDIRTRNGKLTYLSDLDPISVEETPYFGRVIAWRRDAGFAGQPAKVKGQAAARCLAMHSRSVLTFALDGQYEQFKTTLAFDDSAGTRGRVACRVLVDGREVYARPDFRSSEDAQVIDVPLAGAKQLALEVDFGQDEDTGDRILWVEPRLFRAAPQ